MKQPKDMTGEELLAAFQNPRFQPPVEGLINLRKGDRRKDSLFYRHWTAEGKGSLENPRHTLPEEDLSIDRQRAMRIATEVYLPAQLQQDSIGAAIWEAMRLQLERQQILDPWVQDLPISYAHVSPAVIHFIEQRGEGWHWELNRRMLLANDIKQAGAHLTYRGILQSDAALADQGRDMIQDGARLLTGCLTDETNHPPAAICQTPLPRCEGRARPCGRSPGETGLHRRYDCPLRD